jgi:hypothetical protein
MPTGYTCIIEDGNPTLKQYALRCARAFGALSHMREDGLDAPLVARRPDTEYEEKRLAAARRELEVARALTPADAQKLVDEQYVERRKSWEKRELERCETLDKYERMKIKILAWEIPSPEHQKLKDFMLSQIEDSTRGMKIASPPPTKLDAKDYLADLLDSLQDDVIRYSKEIKKIQESTESANKWAKDLMESL